MPALLRNHLGEVIRESRKGQGRTLRDVSASARVSLGYLSEVERGEKEASSELLAAICEALDLPLSRLLHEVAGRFADAEVEAVAVPVTLPVRHASHAEAPAA